MKSIIDNIQIFKDYFTGKIPIEEVQLYLEAYNYLSADFARDFQDTPIDADEQTIEAMINLLLQLNVDFTLWQGYFRQQLSLYNLLKEITKDHEHSIQLNHLLDLLAKKRFESELILAKHLAIVLLVCVPFIGVGLFYLWESLFHFLFDTANILPILGVFFSIGLLLFNLYLNHLNDRRPAYKIYRDDAFIVTNSLLNIVGKIALILTPLTYTVTASIFFLLAAIIEIAKESWYLYELDFDFSQKHILNETDSVILYQQFARLEHDYFRQRNKLIINLLGAILLIGVLIACHFVPVGLTLTLLTSVSIGIIYLLKLLALHINDQVVSNQLQTELTAINEAHAQLEVDDLVVQQMMKSVQHIEPEVSEPAQENYNMSQSMTRSNLVFFKASPKAANLDSSLVEAASL